MLRHALRVQRRLFAGVCLLIALSLLVIPGTPASDPPEMITEITADTISSPGDAPLGSGVGWPQSIRQVLATPVLHDLDGDGVREVIVGDSRWAWVWDAFGNLRSGWPRVIGASLHQAAVGDIDGDGSLDIAFTSIFFSGGQTNPTITVIDESGNTLPGWPRSLPFETTLNLSAPVIADIDGDGELDVGAASEMGLSFFDSDGEALPGWPYLWDIQFNNAQWSSPAIGDLDRDGTLEIVVSGSSTRVVHVVRGDGTTMPGWPKTVGGVLFSSPALADLDSDGDLEIVQHEGESGSLGRFLHVWHHDGAPLAGWPRAIHDHGDGSRGASAIADVDGDGAPEIVTPGGDGRLHVLNADGSYVPNFPLDTGGSVLISSPAVVDVDGDDLHEIFLTYVSSPGVQVVAGWSLDGEMLPGFPQTIFEGGNLAAHASSHVADVDGDGDHELVVAGTGHNSGSVWVLPIDPSIVTVTVPPDDWPNPRREAQNRGCFCEFGEQGNLPPSADAGMDDTVECTGDLSATITLDGSASSDPDSAPDTNDDIVLFEWFENFGTAEEISLGTGELLDAELSVGAHVITLFVEDSGGVTDTDQVTITVQDTLPPSIAVTLAPDLLWPPNHHMVDVDASVITSDVCSTPSVVLTSVTSNEADNGAGDGNTVNDIQDAEVGTADFSFKLRAERAGGGNGRIYTATYTATDATGNATSASGFSVVPHDQGGLTDPMAIALEESEGGTLILWNQVTSAQSYDVIRGRVSEITETDVAISLGNVVCIEDDSLDESTAGWEDVSVPTPGEAFFYLVEYDDGTSSSYGAESANKPRAPGPGGCE